MIDLGGSLARFATSWEYDAHIAVRDVIDGKEEELFKGQNQIGALAVSMVSDRDLKAAGLIYEKLHPIIEKNCPKLFVILAYRMYQMNQRGVEILTGSLADLSVNWLGSDIYESLMKEATTTKLARIGLCLVHTLYNAFDWKSKKISMTSLATSTKWISFGVMCSSAYGELGEVKAKLAKKVQGGDAEKPSVAEVARAVNFVSGYLSLNSWLVPRFARPYVKVVNYAAAAISTIALGYESFQAYKAKEWGALKRPAIDTVSSIGFAAL